MWEYSVNGNHKQKVYGNFLLRWYPNCKEFWILNLKFFGMVMKHEVNLRKAVKFIKSLNK